MKTFKHKSNGSTMTYKDGCMKIENLVIEGEPNLDYWEEVVDKEYEILSFILRDIIYYVDYKAFANLCSNPKYSSNFSLNFALKNDYNIHSVKRLSDGEVFTLGDKVQYRNEDTMHGIITNFEEIGNEMIVFYGNQTSKLSNVKLVKTPLYISTDGYEMYEDDIYYVPQRNLTGFYSLPMQFKVSVSSKFEDTNVKRFAKKENAEEFIRKENSYTTVEGNRIREGQVFYIYNDVKFKCEETSYGHFKNEKYNGKRFKTKEEVEQIILMNKPCLSLNDLLSVWGTCNTTDVYASSPMFQNFKDLAVKKIK